MTINWLLWLGLFVTYFILDGVSAKNVIATNKLDKFPAANSSAFLWGFSIVGSYICLSDGLINIIPICMGAWLGTYFTIDLEIKHINLWDKFKKLWRQKVVGEVSSKNVQR